MRWIIDLLIGLMLVGILAGVVSHFLERREAKHRDAAVQSALAELHQSIVTHAQLDISLLEEGIDPEAVFPDDTEETWPGAGVSEIYPARLSPQWFVGSSLPRNAHAGERHPAIDVAPPGDMAVHPPDPVLESDAQAGFWYNPNRGIFRARVPRQFTDQQTLALYNRLNDSALAELPADETPGPTRRASAMALTDARKSPVDQTSAPAEPNQLQTIRRSLLDPPATSAVNTPN